jgi:ABC-type glucose/galactose transport system permease subunit
MGTSVSSTNKTDHHDITEIWLKVALNTITLTTTPSNQIIFEGIISLLFKFACSTPLQTFIPICKSLYGNKKACKVLRNSHLKP